MPETIERLNTYCLCVAFSEISLSSLIPLIPTVKVYTFSSSSHWIDDDKIRDSSIPVIEGFLYPYLRVKVRAFDSPVLIIKCTSVSSEKSSPLSIFTLSKTSFVFIVKLFSLSVGDTLIWASPIKSNQFKTIVRSSFNSWIWTCPLPVITGVVFSLNTYPFLLTTVTTACLPISTDHFPLSPTLISSPVSVVTLTLSICSPLSISSEYVVISLCESSALKFKSKLLASKS